LISIQNHDQYDQNVIKNYFNNNNFVIIHVFNFYN